MIHEIWHNSIQLSALSIVTKNIKDLSVCVIPLIPKVCINYCYINSDGLLTSIISIRYFQSTVRITRISMSMAYFLYLWVLVQPRYNWLPVCIPFSTGRILRKPPLLTLPWCNPYTITSCINWLFWCLLWCSMLRYKGINLYYTHPFTSRLTTYKVDDQSLLEIECCTVISFKLYSNCYLFCSFRYIRIFISRIKYL